MIYGRAHSMGPSQPKSSAGAAARPLFQGILRRFQPTWALGAGLLAAAGSARAADGPDSELTPGPSKGTAQLRVQIAGERGEIFIDGESVGRGRYVGTLTAGRHLLRIIRDGHDVFEREVVLEPGEVRSESVTLRPSVSEVEKPGTAGVPDAMDGIYGGIQLLAAFVPGGKGTTFQDACDSIGASSCAPGSVTAGGLSGYIGYMLEPVGLELALLGSGDFSGPSASFDGRQGSEINPVVASPARKEDFSIAAFGTGAMLRLRLATKLSRVRFNFALGPGLAYRFFAMKRDTSAGDGRTGFYSDVGASYVSALLSLEASAALELGGSTALAFGVTSWFEHAGDETTSRPEERAVLTSNDGRQPIPQATPRYDLANGPQWFLGPFLGLTFGP
jgi:hypothetical protein